MIECRSLNNRRVHIPYTLFKCIADMTAAELAAREYRITVACVDGLGPDINIDERLAAGCMAPRPLSAMSTMKTVVPAFALIASPASNTYIKMSPDPDDQFTGDESALLKTHEPIFRGLNPDAGWPVGWSVATPDPCQRNTMYDLIANADLLIPVPEDENPYSNIIVTLDLLKQSPITQKMVSLIREGHGPLIKFLLESGHGNGVVIIPEKHVGEFEGLEESNFFIRSNAHMLRIMSIISDNWLPDLYPRPTQSKLQRGAAFIPLQSDSVNPLIDNNLKNGWGDPKICQKMTLGDLQTFLLQEKRSVLKIAVRGGDCILGMFNGTSGADGGFGTKYP